MKLHGVEGKKVKCQQTKRESLYARPQVKNGLFPFLRKTKMFFKLSLNTKVIWLFEYWWFVFSRPADGSRKSSWSFVNGAENWWNAAVLFWSPVRRSGTPAARRIPHVTHGSPQIHNTTKQKPTNKQVCENSLSAPHVGFSSADLVKEKLDSEKTISKICQSKVCGPHVAPRVAPAANYCFCVSVKIERLVVLL